MKTETTASQLDLTQLIQEATTQHHPVKLQVTAGNPNMVLISQADLDTAQAVIEACIGRPVPFLIA